ncbi:allergen Asp f 7 homolog isoform X2 [Penaeus japonicus]|nr:allergen Asp f 7 homolog isoform X2 [Penaeus japonicus]
MLHILLLVAVTRADKLPWDSIRNPVTPPAPSSESTQAGTSSYSSYNAGGAGMYGQTSTQTPVISSFYGAPIAPPPSTTTTTTLRPVTTPMSYGPAPPSSTPSTPPGSLPYPSYNAIPPGLGFTCTGRLDGYYADPEAQCQVWHWCVPGGDKYSFLCPVQTLFNQATRTCDWWYNVDCQAATSLYANNAELYKV